MGASKVQLEDIGYSVARIIKEDLPCWPTRFDEEDVPMEEQIVNAIISGHFISLRSIVWDLILKNPVGEISKRVCILVEALDDLCTVENAAKFWPILLRVYMNERY